ncbi:MAG: pH regulation protein F [Elusimicrobia bacterium]|nr:pH regulation protein F [Elusimicrobiota bacterium]
MFSLASLWLIGIVFIYLYRVLKGPTVFDRLIGLNGISTQAVILLIFLGALEGRLEMFVDIALGYTLLNLVSSLAVAKYLERRKAPGAGTLAPSGGPAGTRSSAEGAG